MSAHVQGQCPMGCGATLFLGSGGWVTCSWQYCPEPDAASTLLEQSRQLRTAQDILALLAAPPSGEKQ